MRTFSLVSVLIGLAAGKAVEQELDDGLPTGYPDPEIFVNQFLENPSAVTYRMPWPNCPSTSQWHEEVFDFLLALDLELSPQTGAMAGGFSGLSEKCGDPRFDEWYRKYLLEAAGQELDASVLAYGKAFLRSPTAEKKDYVTAIVTDGRHKREIRHIAGAILLDVMPFDEQEEFFFRYYEDELLPETLVNAEASVLSRERTESFSQHMSAIVRRNPKAPQLHQVLWEVTQAFVEKVGPVLPEAREFLITLQQLEARPDNEVSPTMKGIVSEMRRRLQERVGGWGGG